MFKHVLIPTDGSPIALKAAKAAIRFAADAGARVTAFHAIEAWQPQLYGEGYGIDAQTFQEFERAAREAGERQVAAVAKLAKAARVPFASLVARPLLLTRASSTPRARRSAMSSSSPRTAGAAYRG